jgi:hypothetical protein
MTKESIWNAVGTSKGRVLGEKNCPKGKGKKINFTLEHESPEGE